MRRYSLAKLLAVLLVSLTVSYMLTVALRQLLLYGKLFGLQLTRFRPAALPHSFWPWLCWPLFFLPLLLLWTRIYARKKPAQILQPGLFHYYQTAKFGAKRLHLRLENDLSGLLMVDAARIIHLNNTAALMVKLFLDGYSRNSAIHHLAGHFHIPEKKAGSDYDSVLERINLLIHRDDICPISYFDIEKIDAFQTPVSAPYRLDLALTYRCNINCFHCYNRRRESAELTSEEWKQVLSILWQNGIPHVDFTGGEPTLRPDLPELIEYAENLGMITGLISNGVKLAEAGYAGQLAQAGLDYAQITVEAPQQDVHDRMVGSEAFDLTIQGIKNAQKNGIHVLTNTTVTRENARHLDLLVPFLQNLGVSSFAVNSIINAGKSRDRNFGFREEELAPIIEKLRDQANAAGLKFIWYTPTQYCAFNPMEMDVGVKQCTAGKYNLAIEPDGNVIPCQSFYHPVGHILHDSWPDIYHNDFLEKLRQREWIMEKCRACQWLATCAGGCPLQVQDDNFCCPDLLSNP